MKLTTFTVEGNGTFPFDMLRYDACWPNGQSDTAEIERTTRRGHGPWRVTMATYSGLPTVERWESFGCAILEATRR